MIALLAAAAAAAAVAQMGRCTPAPRPRLPGSSSLRARPSSLYRGRRQRGTGCSEADGRRPFLAADVFGGDRTLFLLPLRIPGTKSSVCCTIYTVVNVTFCKSVNIDQKDGASKLILKW